MWKIIFIAEQDNSFFLDSSCINLCPFQMSDYLDIDSENDTITDNVGKYWLKVLKGTPGVVYSFIQHKNV